MKAPYPRRRTRGGLVMTPLNRVTDDSTSGTSVLTYASYPTQAQGISEVMNDIVTPGFSFMSAKGEIINNPKDWTRTYYSFGNGNATWSAISPPSHVGKHTYHDSGGSWGAYTDAIDTNLSLKGNILGDDVITKNVKLGAIQARNRISKIHVQSLVSLAELPKTINLLTQTVKTLYQVIKGVKTGNAHMVISAIGRRTKENDRRNWFSRSAGNRWLEYRYGWTPLVMELQGALKALDKSRVLQKRATARGRVFEVQTATTTKNQSLGDDGDIVYTYDKNLTVLVRAFCLYTADLTYQSARDFGVTELPLAAWELVPFSFVIDWFVQIGDWLEAVTPKLGIQILAEGYTVTTTNSIHRTGVYTPKPAHATLLRHAISGLDLDDRLVIDKRDRFRGLGLVLANPPPVNVKLNVKRAVDAVALIKALADI